MSFDESKHPRDDDGKFTDGTTESSADRLKRIREKYFPRVTKKPPEPLNKNADLTNEAEHDTIKLPDIYIGRSVGAKAKNYKVLDLDTGEFFEFVEGTKIENVEVFAGKGVKSTYRNAERYASKFGGRPKDWQHAKGVGWLKTLDGPRRAEVHWSQCDGVGKVDFFVKEWL